MRQMRQINITPTTINRVEGEQIANPNYCDELINVRHTSGTLRVVGSKVLRHEQTEVKRIFIHKLSDKDITIGINDSNDVFIYDDGVTTQIDTFPDDDELGLATIANFLVISSKSHKRNHIYIYRNNQYDKFFDGYFPEVIFGYSLSNIETVTHTIEGLRYKYKDMGTTFNANIAYEDVLAGLNFCRFHHNERFTEGMILVSCTYSLFDGSETKPTPPVAIHLGYFHSIQYKDGSGDDTTDIVVNTQKLSLNLSSLPDYTTYKDLIKSINVYCTRPKSHLDLEQTFKYDQYEPITTILSDESIDDLSIYEDSASTESGYVSGFRCTRTDYSKIGNELFYLQKEIPFVEDTSQMTESFEFTFGEIMMSGRVMEVDASGYLARYGVPFSYNNRIHLGGVSTTALFPMSNSTNFFRPIQATSGSGWGYTWTAYAYIYFNINGAEEVICRRLNVYARLNQATNEYEFLLRRIVCFPDSRVKHIDLYVANASSYYKISLPMTESASYNYSYCDVGMLNNGSADGLLDRTDAFVRIPYSNMSSTRPSVAENLGFVYDESYVLLVSAQNNPCFFDVSNSYHISGNIKDITISVTSISDVQVGQYPLNIFTDNGIYSISQGDGKILYSNIFKISEEVVEDNGSVTTEAGTVFISGDGLYLLSGKEVSRISSALDGRPDFDVRKCANYALAHKNTNTYDASGVLSARDFRSFITQGEVFLSYDILHQEVIVSSSLHNYSYVYELTSGLWHKISGTYRGGNSRYLIVPNGTFYDIFDASEESDDSTSSIFHIQTRALNMGGYGYKTLGRVIARLNANNPYTVLGVELSTALNNMVGMYIYGSNDLKEWFMIGAAQSKGYTNKLQVDRPYGSFKYYIITIGGWASTNSDISTIEVEVTDKYNNRLR